MGPAGLHWYSMEQSICNPPQSMRWHSTVWHKPPLVQVYHIPARTVSTMRRKATPKLHLLSTVEMSHTSNCSIQEFHHLISCRCSSSSVSPGIKSAPKATLLELEEALRVHQAHRRKTGQAGELAPLQYSQSMFSQHRHTSRRAWHRFRWSWKESCWCASAWGSRQRERADGGSLNG